MRPELRDCDEPPVLQYATRQRGRRRTSLLTLWLMGIGLAIPLILLLVPTSGTVPRWKAMRAVCASHLRTIGQAAMVYANDNDGDFPPALQMLIDNGSCEARHLLSPLSRHVEPACDYSYVTGLTKRDPANWIIAFADPAYRDGDGANVLYLDGHVEYVKEPKFSQELQRFKAAYEKTRGTPPVIIPPH